MLVKLQLTPIPLFLCDLCKCMTKCMLFSTPQMSSYHSLAERPIHLSVGDKPLERVHSIKLLGVRMTDTLKWDDHVKHFAYLVMVS